MPSESDNTKVPAIAPATPGVQSGYETKCPGPQIVSECSGTSWPLPMGQEAFIGVAGDFVRLVGPETEADPAGLLAHFLICAGVLFARDAWIIADGRKHYPVEFALTAGATGSGRKGTASEQVRALFRMVEPFFDSRVLTGLSSGEGLIKGVSGHNPSEVGSFLVYLPEFAQLLSVMTRQGNTLSPVLREAWDCQRLRVLTRKEALDVDNVNIAVIAHVTPQELLNGLTATDRANGFANRFLILLVNRSKVLPDGGEGVNLTGIASRITAAIEAAKCRGQMRRNGSARELWRKEYPRLTAGDDGIKGALCGRAEAHVLRLSLLYSLLDSADSVRLEHLEAALAFWDYCERSVSIIFGTLTGDEAADKILSALAVAREPLKLTDIHNLFNRNRNADWIRAKMGELVSNGKAVQSAQTPNAGAVFLAWELKR